MADNVPEKTEAVEATVAAIVAWMRSIPPEWREDWGLNATEELADQIEGLAWMFGPILPVHLAGTDQHTETTGEKQ